MADDKHGKVVEVDSKNFEENWSMLQKMMWESSFISLDAEMSGLGSSNTFQSHAEDRYQTLKTAACTRSLISLGMTCFTLVGQTDSSIAGKPNSATYKATSYNILMLCAESFSIDPSAVSFLSTHGFDFNKLFSSGLKYRKGDYVTETAKEETFARKIFEELIRVRKPIIVHNGFCDLIYMYECLYAPCPNKLSTFLSDLSEMFPSGIYDTKVIAKFHEKLNSSFLEYVVKCFHTKNAKAASNSKPNVVIEIPSGTIEDLLGPVVTVDNITSAKKICVQYMKHGFCESARTGKCDFSHNVSDILIYEEKKKRKRPSKSETCDGATKKFKSDFDGFSMPCHRAGVDSFFTGYSFAVFTVLHTTELQSYIHSSSDTKAFSSAIPNLPESFKVDIINRLYMNSHHPLWVSKSHFAKTSTPHEQNILRIFLG